MPALLSLGLGTKGVFGQALPFDEGMSPDFPPEVCFNEFNPDCLNILMMYWYNRSIAPRQPASVFEES